MDLYLFNQQILVAATRPAESWAYTSYFVE